jgi:lipopolysaccharide/colanic/teichoic acid biosynthesis glycosyltransferase
MDIPRSWSGDSSRAFDLLFRARDLVVSLSALVLAAPVMLVIAIMIRLDSPGPALFKQRRVGRQQGNGNGATNGVGDPFVFYKFRTMHADAPDRYPDLYRYDFAPGEIETMTFKILDDPRLTRVGRWLRKTSLDELPNFINVLRGEMSLVGPRPDIPEMLPYYKDWQRIKFAVRPGITGYAQTSGRGLLTFQETLQQDVQYVLERSFRNDLRILWKTIWVTLRRVGAF